MRLVWLAGLAVGMCVTVSAQAPQTKTDAEITAEAAQATSLYDKANMVAAVPLYEDLHAQRPQSFEFTERLAMTLTSKAAQQPDAEARATRQRARKLFLEAKAAGDNSNFVQVMLEKLPENEAPETATPPIPGQEWVQKGEVAFTSGDLQTALGFYAKALEVNPQYYAAALFAGDAEFKLNHPAEAGKWFAKAIAINPDKETAHRYWGDCLDKAGEHKQAESEFIEAIIADPYERTPRVGLKQWADANHARIAPPPITLPKRAEPDAKGDTNIDLDMSTMMSPAGAGWLVYLMSPTVWQKGEFAKHYPNETKYRHSLAEESQALHSVLSILKEKKVSDSKLDPTLKSLIAIDKDGMLDCYILFDAPDQGIAQDYVAYRAEHRELMHRYIEKYDIHPM